MPRLDGSPRPAGCSSRRGDGAPRVLILTTFDRNEYVYEALRAGASGFLLKDMPGQQLVAGVRAVASGEALVATRGDEARQPPRDACVLHLLPGSARIPLQVLQPARALCRVDGCDLVCRQRAPVADDHCRRRSLSAMAAMGCDVSAANRFASRI